MYNVREETLLGGVVEQRTRQLSSGKSTSQTTTLRHAGSISASIVSTGLEKKIDRVAFRGLTSTGVEKEKVTGVVGGCY
jgi:hypothetical protein